MWPKFLVGDHLGLTTPCSGPSYHSSTPLPSLPVGWMLSFHGLGWAVACSPAKVVGCSQHGCCGHASCCHQRTPSARLESCKYGIAFHAGELLTPPDGKPWPRMSLVGCRMIVGSTALCHLKKTGVMTKLSSFICWTIKSTCKCIRKNKGVLSNICSFFSLCSELLSMTNPYLLIKTMGQNWFLTTLLAVQYQSQIILSWWKFSWQQIVLFSDFS